MLGNWIGPRIAIETSGERPNSNQLNSYVSRLEELEASIELRKSNIQNYKPQGFVYNCFLELKQTNTSEPNSSSNPDVDMT